MIRISTIVWTLALALMTSELVAQVPSATDEPSTRHFELTYSGSVNALPKGATVRVWLPIAQTTSDQTVVQMKSQLPDDARETSESTHGNKMLYLSLIHI